jgi:threonine synthase
MQSVAKKSHLATEIFGVTELLPIEGEPRIGMHSGFTPLVRARRLEEALGVQEPYIKDDSVNHPTFSYKDRVVAVNFDQLYQDLNPPIVKAAGT